MPLAPGWYQDVYVDKSVNPTPHSESWYKRVPDSKVYGANMGPIWGRQDPGGPHVGHMNFCYLGCYKHIYLPLLVDAKDAYEVACGAFSVFVPHCMATYLTESCIINVLSRLIDKPKTHRNEKADCSLMNSIIIMNQCVVTSIY